MEIRFSCCISRYCFKVSNKKVAIYKDGDEAMPCGYSFARYVRGSFSEGFILCVHNLYHLSDLSSVFFEFYCFFHF